MEVPGWQSSRWYEVAHPPDGWDIPPENGDALKTVVDLEQALCALVWLTWGRGISK